MFIRHSKSLCLWPCTALHSTLEVKVPSWKTLNLHITLGRHLQYTAACPRWLRLQPCPCLCHFFHPPTFSCASLHKSTLVWQLDDLQRALGLEKQEAAEQGGKKWGCWLHMRAVKHTWPPPLACCDAPPPERRSSPDRGPPAGWPSQHLSRGAESLSRGEIEWNQCQGQRILLCDAFVVWIRRHGQTEPFHCSEGDSTSFWGHVWSGTKVSRMQGCSGYWSDTTHLHFTTFRFRRKSY